MFLTEISDLIVIDGIINEKKYTHFLTHCENRFFTESEFSSKIYTSKNIARILYRHKKIPINVFNILQSNHTTKINLSNGEDVNVTLFEGDKYTNNICFHFQNNSTTLFYSGHFRNIYSLFRNQLCFDLIKPGVDYLYLDNTRANAEYLSSLNEIGLKLKQIMKTHPNYKIIISLPNYGYEDLLVNLLLKHEFKIFIGIHQKDILTHLKFDNYLVNTIKEAQIIIRKDVVDMDCIKERYSKKHGITVRIVEYEKEVLVQNFEHVGLFQIHYSPHINHFELFALISFLQPKYVREIYSEFSVTPKVLKEASLVLNLDDVYYNNNNDEFNDNDTFTKVQTVKSEIKCNNNNQIEPPQEHTLNITKIPGAEMNLNNSNDKNKNDNIKNKLETPKPQRRYNKTPIDLELAKPNVKNIIKELYDEYNDVDNVGDYCVPKTDDVPKNINDVPIFNSENSDISKSVLDNWNLYNKSKPEFKSCVSQAIMIPNVQKYSSPRIGIKRLTTYDDQIHTPKEKHRKLLIANSTKESNTINIPELKFNVNQKKTNIVKSSNTTNQKSQLSSLMKAKYNRNVSGCLPGRTKNVQKKNTVNNNNTKSKFPLTNEYLRHSVDHSTKLSTNDYTVQKSIKKQNSRLMEFIYNDED